MLVSSDMMLSVASILYVICAIPQLIRNLQFKDTITQSIFSNLIIFIASLVSLIAYINLGLLTASVFLILELLITFILIIQIMVWRKNRKNKKLKAFIDKTEGARSVLKSIKGMK